MAWGFSTDREYSEQLAWMREVVNSEIIPLEVLDLEHETLLEIIAPCRSRFASAACGQPTSPRELGGQGFGQVKLALLHEILGRCLYFPLVFDNNGPESGNAELLALGSTSGDQRRRWLEPLLDGRLRSAFSMTEPEVAGSDPTLLQTSHPLAD